MELMTIEDQAYLERFLESIAVLEDPRVERTKRHSLELLIFVAKGCKLTGGDSFYDMELFAETQSEYLGKHFGMVEAPSHDTFNRLFEMLDPGCLERFLREFAQALRLQGAEGAKGEGEEEERDIIAIDGKTVRRSHKGGAPALHILNAWAGRNRLVIGQLATEAKSNEITAAPELLRTLDIKGCIVTADALITQKAIAAQIVEQGGDYLLALKGNHPLAEAEVRAFMEEIAGRTPPGFESCDKGHGRLETRRLWQSEDTKWFADAPAWKGLRSFALLHGTREFPDGTREESRRLYLSSLPLDAPLLAKAARSHWGIENSCHWCLDVLFDEDQSRARSNNAARNLSALRKHCLNLLRSSANPPTRRKNPSISAKMYLASQSFPYLLSLLCSFPPPINSPPLKI
jgi:predicted transposase YbfD/YdcC